jgi:hypothetical protein
VVRVALGKRFRQRFGELTQHLGGYDGVSVGQPHTCVWAPRNDRGGFGAADRDAGGAGAIAAGAAFTIGFAIFHEALASALLSMGLLTLGLASGTLIASLGAQITWLVLVLVVVAAVNYGILSGLSPTAGWMGQQCAVFVIVASFFPHGLRDAAGRTAMVMAGGALQMLVFTGFYLVRHRAREAAAGPLGGRLRLRTRELMTRLRTELKLTGSTASYAIRLSVTLLLCTELYRRFHVRNGYWSPMTALLVLKPQWTDTLSRGIARLVGTVAGAGVALLLGMYVPLDTAVIVSLILVSAWACYTLQAVNYAAFSLFVTLYIVYLFRLGGFSQTAAAHIRLFNTALGGTIAIMMDVAWKMFAQKKPAD